MSLQKDKERLEAQRQALENEQVFTNWLRTNPQYACEANQQMIFAYLDRELPISEADLDFTVRMIGNKLAVKSAKSVAQSQLEELQERNAEIESENKRKLSLSKGELRAEIRASMPSLVPALPEKWTPEAIKAAPVDELKKLIRMYGANVVNQRLGAKPIDFKGQYGRPY